MEGLNLKVAVLYNLLERLEKGEEKDLLAEEAVHEEIGSIEEGIRSQGYQFFVMAVQNEIDPIIHWLKEIRPDVVFNLCESVYGDACMELNIPALLDLLRIPYTGSPPLTLGLCQDKGKVKDILSSQGILTPRYKIFDREVGSLKGNIFPIIVKPLHEDGSLGISKESVVYDDEGLNRQIRYVIEKYQQPALVEEYIEGRELNVGLMETNGKVSTLPISEIDYSEFPEGIPRICGYEAKWMQESIEYQKSKPVCPAPLEWVVQKRVEHLAIKVFKLFGCRDYARVDMRIDRGGKIYILEVNPNPDISPPSGMARAIRVQGMTYSEFIGKVIDKALQRRDREIRG
ncbi:MAG: ATP-grasp domain-containing protein [Deltaproteobacteria bacterium]|nr:ATP-grasp domain-containing protein [Deltaproteobacteria bacterium]